MPSCHPVLQLFVMCLLGYFLAANVTFEPNRQPKSTKQTKKEPTRKTDKVKTESKTEPQQKKISPAKNEKITRKTAGNTQNEEQEKREQAVTIGTMLLIGVLILGFFMISLILIWGRRMRRIAKSRGPKQTMIDPLWYLKSREKEESISPTDEQNGSDRFDSTES